MGGAEDIYSVEILLDSNNYIQLMPNDKPDIGNGANKQLWITVRNKMLLLVG